MFGKILVTLVTVFSCPLISSVKVTVEGTTFDTVPLYDFLVGNLA